MWGSPAAAGLPNRRRGRLRHIDLLRSYVITAETVLDFCHGVLGVLLHDDRAQSLLVTPSYCPRKVSHRLDLT